MVLLLREIVKAPLNAWAASGKNWNWKFTVAPGFSPVVVPCVWPNSAGATLTALIWIFLGPMFVTAKFFVTLPWPTVTLPKSKDVGETDRVGMPVPDNGTTIGLSPEIVSVNCPLKVVFASGANFTLY